MEKSQFNSSKISQLFYYDSAEDIWIPVSSASPLPVSTNVTAGTDLSIYNEVLSINSGDLTKVVDYTVPTNSIFF